MGAAARRPAKAAPYHTMVKITPQLAEEMLKGNEGNRPISRGHVDGLARDMIAGRWRFDGSTLKVSPSGRLLDGQHRLLAVVQSKRTIEFLVVYNVADDAMENIDRNRVRSIGDLLRINLGIQYATWIAAIVRTIARIETGYDATSGPRMTYGETQELYERFKTEIDWCIEAVGYEIEPGIPSGGAVVLGAFAYMHRVDPAKLTAMAYRFKNGEITGTGDPAEALRRAAAAAQQKGSWVKRDLTARTLRAIEAELSGEKLHLAKVDTGIFERAIAAHNASQAA